MTSLPTSQTDLQRRFVVETGQAATIAALIEPRLEAMGFRLVRISISGRNGSTVQIMAERPDGRLTVGECERISRDISPALDVADIVHGRYHLEVSSPGIDRPLVRPSDFVTWAGYEARIELKEPVGDLRRMRGRLDGFAEGEVRIEVDDVPGASGPQFIGVPMALVESARLVLTDELIREDLRRSRESRKHSAEADLGGDGEDEAMENGHGPDRG